MNAVNTQVRQIWKTIIWFKYVLTKVNQRVLHLIDKQFPLHHMLTIQKFFNQNCPYIKSFESLP